MMTKAEKAALDAAIYEARRNRALRWSDPAPARDVPIPPFGVETTGWDFNAASARGCSVGLASGAVFPAWSRAVANGTGSSSLGQTGTQRGRALYSTRALALRALRAAIEQETAALLADIDAELEKEMTA